MKRICLLAVLVVASPAPSMAATFEEIMASISKAGSISNGDGHYWAFKSVSNGWKVEGAQGQSAFVTGGGENQVKIDGFPPGWRADGVYKFTQAERKCTLASTTSRHKLTWNC